MLGKKGGYKGARKELDKAKRERGFVARDGKGAEGQKENSRSYKVDIRALGPRVPASDGGGNGEQP